MRRLFLPLSLLALAGIAACSVTTTTIAANTADAGTDPGEGGATGDAAAATPCADGALVDLGTVDVSAQAVELAASAGFVAITHDGSVRVVGLDGRLRSDTSLPAGWLTASVASSADRIVVATSEEYGEPNEFNGRFNHRVVASVLDDRGALLHTHVVLSDATQVASGMTVAIDATDPTVASGTAGFVVGFGTSDLSAADGTVAARWLDSKGGLLGTAQAVLIGATGLYRTSYALAGTMLLVTSKADERTVAANAYPFGGSGAPAFTAAVGTSAANETEIVSAANEQGFLVAMTGSAGSPPSSTSTAHLFSLTRAGKVSGGAAATSALGALVATDDGRFAGLLGTDLAFFDGAGNLVKKRALPASLSAAQTALGAGNGQVIVAWRDLTTGQVSAQALCY